MEVNIVDSNKYERLISPDLYPNERIRAENNSDFHTGKLVPKVQYSSKLCCQTTVLCCQTTILCCQTTILCCQTTVSIVYLVHATDKIPFCVPILLF